MVHSQAVHPVLVARQGSLSKAICCEKVRKPSWEASGAPALRPPYLVQDFDVGAAFSTAKPGKSATNNDCDTGVPASDCLSYLDLSSAASSGQRRLQDPVLQQIPRLQLAT
jgi:hypothetical protein